MENLISFDISNILTLIATPLGLAALGMLLTAFLVDKVQPKAWKIFVSWAVGVVLTLVVCFIGRKFGIGMFAGFVFDGWQAWATFIVLCISPGMMSNGIYDSKILSWLLKFLGKS
jgi:hypothetical protein